MTHYHFIPYRGIDILDALLIAQYYVGLIFTFSEVNDSRCPTDVVCVWEGEAVVNLHCWSSYRYLGVMEMKAPPAEPPYDYVDDPGNLHHYQLTCKAVDPYPEGIDRTPEEEYVVTLNCMVTLP